MNRDALESERDFLLESLRQLDADKASGTLTETEYIDLRDEQTVRAATILEQLETAEPPPSDAPAARTSSSQRASLEERSGRALLGNRRALWVAAVAGFVVVAVVGLIGAASGRLGGASSTGSIKGDSNTLLAVAQEQSGQGKVADAVKTYDQVLQQDPNNVQALTYKGWLIRLAGLPQQGLDSINKAVALNPNYPDAHFFKGFILFRDHNDPKSAITEFNAFLADNPPQDMVPLVQQTLQDAQAEAATATAPAAQ